MGKWQTDAKRIESGQREGYTQEKSVLDFSCFTVLHRVGCKGLFPWLSRNVADFFLLVLESSSFSPKLYFILSTTTTTTLYKCSLSDISSHSYWCVGVCVDIIRTKRETEKKREKNFLFCNPRVFCVNSALIIFPYTGIPSLPLVPHFRAWCFLLFKKYTRNLSRHFKNFLQHSAVRFLREGI